MMSSAPPRRPRNNNHHPPTQYTPALQEELTVVMPPPKPAIQIFSPNCSWCTLLILGLVANLILAVIFGFGIYGIIHSREVTKDLSELKTFLGVASSFLSQVQSAGLDGTPVFNALAAGMISSPVPPVHYVTLPNTNFRMAYRSRGDCLSNSTDVIIYIHELGLGSAMWNTQLNRMGGGYCCIAIDLMGHGLSDPASSISGGSLSAQTSYLRQFIIGSGLLANPRDLYFVGSGFGSSVAMQYISSFPGDVSSMVMVNPVPVLVNPPNENFGGFPSYAAVQATAAVVLSNLSAYAAGSTESYLVGDSCYTSPQMNSVTASLTAMTMMADPHAIADGFLSWGLTDQRGLFASCPITVSLFVGANYQPQYVNVVNLAELARDLYGTGTSLHVMAGASGLPQITHADEFITYARSFFDGQGQSCPDMHPDWLSMSV